jgi:hypothetical protein
VNLAFEDLFAQIPEEFGESGANSLDSRTEWRAAPLFEQGFGIAGHDPRQLGGLYHLRVGEKGRDANGGPAAEASTAK